MRNEVFLCFVACVYAFCGTSSILAADVAEYDAILSTLSRRSEWPAARFALAETLFHSQDWKKAVAQWEKLVADHQNDALAPKALWRIVVTQSGPLNDKPAAIKTAQRLLQAYPKDLYGERACLGEAYLLYWSNSKARARVAVNRYLQIYPDGRFTKAANQLLADLK